MSTHLECAARLNNDAVDRLMAGDNQIAMARFKKSAALLRRGVLLNQAARQQKVSRPVNLLQEQLAPILLSPPDPIEDICIHHASSPLFRLTDRQSYYIYNHALHFSLDDYSLENFESSTHILSAMILFNLSLAFHRVYEQNGKKACARRAITMYSMVLKVLKNDSSTAGTAAVVKVATINNMSQLRFQEGDYGQAQQSLVELSQRLHFLKSRCPQELFKDDEFRGIMLNVLFFRAPRVAGAA
jgi:hypothetical protein